MGKRQRGGEREGEGEERESERDRERERERERERRERKEEREGKENAPFVRFRSPFLFPLSVFLSVSPLHFYLSLFHTFLLSPQPLLSLSLSLSPPLCLFPILFLTLSLSFVFPLFVFPFYCLRSLYSCADGVGTPITAGRLSLVVCLSIIKSVAHDYGCRWPPKAHALNFSVFPTILLCSST